MYEGRRQFRLRRKKKKGRRKRNERKMERGGKETN